MAKRIQSIMLQRNFPVISTILLASCIITTLPMFFDERYYLVLGVENPQLRWWHIIVATFVHGGGFPGKVAHLTINGLFIAVLGTLIERCLGSGRLFICSLGGWTAGRIARHVVKGSWHAHGISLATWGYSVLAMPVLVWAWRRERQLMLKDPFAVLAALLGVMGAVGVVVGFHAVSMTVCACCLGIWWSRLGKNLDLIEAGQRPDSDPALVNWTSIAVVGAAAVINAVVTGGAVLGMVR